MQQMILDRLGTDAPFRRVDATPRALGPNEVRIRVHAASINPVDTKIRSGLLADIAPNPAVLGCDVAGVVTEVGAAVKTIAVGDKVYGCAGGLVGRDGAYATEMVADARLIARKPESLTFREAAALPLVFITAWESLVDRARVRPGDLVLVHGAAGGVGHVGVQLARALGGIVHATVSTDSKAAIARDLGAALGVGGHLTALRRTRVGAFTLEDAATLETIAEQAGDGGVPRVIPMAQAAADSFVVHDLDVEEERALGYGQRIASAHRGEETVAAIAPDGRLAAILDERAATAKSRVTFPA